MAGMFPLLLGLLFATGKFCHATLSEPTSSITPKIAVDADPVISIDVTTSIQATDVQVSLNGARFKTVNIRPSSITVTDDGGASSYDSRVSVTHEALTPNTNVRVNVTFTSIPKADNGLVIKFDDTADVDTKSLTLDVEYCNSTAFDPTAISLASPNTCGKDCTEQFTCNSTFEAQNFIAQCQANASWNVTTAPCSKSCDNSFFTNAVAADDSIVVNGGSKRFNCNCAQPIASFNRTCGSDGQWSNKTNPCSSVCDATIISCGSPVSNGIKCGGERHTFNCIGDVACDPRTFELECQANGTWADTTCNCGTVCSADSITCGSPVSSGSLCGGVTHQFNCNDDLVCAPTTFQLECQASGNWASTTCDCAKATCSDSSIQSICGENCDYRSVSAVSCGETLNYTCTNGAVATVNSAVYCNVTGVFNVSEMICRTPDCQATCSDSSIQSICGENCDYGSVSAVLCGETLNYTCTNGAVATVNSAVYCNATDVFNVSEMICRTPDCQVCDETAIKSICGDNCSYGNVTAVSCGESLNFTCSNGYEKTVTLPVYCKSSNFNETKALCGPPCEGCKGAIAGLLLPMLSLSLVWLFTF